jgi:hypothetical protein
MEEGDVAIFPWPLELITVRNGVWDHRSIVVPSQDSCDT